MSSVNLDDPPEPLEDSDSATALRGNAHDGRSADRAVPFKLFSSISDRVGSLNVRRNPLDGEDVALEADLALLPGQRTGRSNAPR